MRMMKMKILVRIENDVSKQIVSFLSLNLDVILDDENEYESNRYPILIPASNVALDNYELQQQYNTDDLPIDEDFETDFDDDEEEEDDDEQQYGLFNSNERPYYVSDEEKFS